MNASTRAPLVGTTVLDCSELLPGPNAARLLGALGARVIKIERLDGGDRMRFRPDAFEAQNRGKSSVAINLKAPEGAALVRGLVSRADVLVEGYRPGVMERLGLGFAALQEVNAQLIYVSLTGYGQDGPYHDRGGHDFQYLAVAGAIASPPEGMPDGYVPVAAPITGVTTSLYGVLAVALSLMEKMRVGPRFAGRHLDVAMADAALSLMEPRVAETRGHADDGEALKRPGYGVYATRDGKWITLGAIEDHFYAALTDALGLEELTGPEYASFPLRQERYDEIEGKLRAGIAEIDQADAVALLVGRGVPATPVHSGHDAVRDPHFTARGMVRDTDRDVPTVTEWPVALAPFVDPSRLAEAPTLGRDTREILSEIGVGAARLDALEAEGVIKGASG